jgi:hypothetical protein
MGQEDSEDSSVQGCSAADAFAQVNASLLERGLLKNPLDVNDVSIVTRKALADLLLSMLAQRQEDGKFREQLSSKLRVTDSSLERTKRFWKEEQDKTADLTRKLETSKARIR